jgi:hypothetical protein
MNLTGTHLNRILRLKLSFFFFGRVAECDTTDTVRWQKMQNNMRSINISSNICTVTHHLWHTWGPPSCLGITYSHYNKSMYANTPIYVLLLLMGMTKILLYVIHKTDDHKLQYCVKYWILGFVKCGCFGNMCTCIYCVFVLFRLCIFILFMRLFNSVNYVFLLCLCILIMYVLFCIVCFHRANWHS